MLENDLAGRDDEWDALERVALALRQPEDLGGAVDVGVMAALRAEPRPVRASAPALSPPVPAAVAELPTPRWGTAPRRARGGRGWLRMPRLIRWLVEPHTVRLSPLGTLAAAGLAIAAIFGVRRETPRPGGEELLNRTGEFKAPAVGPVGATGEFATIAGARAGSGVPATTVTPVVAAAAARTRDTVFVTRFLLVAPGAQQVTLVGDFNDWDQAATPLVRVAANGMWTVEVPLEAGRYAYAFLVDGQHWVADPGAPRAVGDDFGRPSSVVTVRGSDT